MTFFAVCLFLLLKERVKYLLTINKLYKHINKGRWINNLKVFHFIYRIELEGAERTKNYILSQARFASCVFKRFHKHTPKSARVPGGKRIWKNLRYVEFKSVNVPDKGWQE